MNPSLSFFSFISGLLIEVNDGLQQAFDASQDQSVQFTIPKIEMQLKGTVLNDGGLQFIPSSAEGLNLYGAKGESELKLTFKLKPGE